jgi:hypothetical protein
MQTCLTARSLRLEPVPTARVYKNL